MNSEIKFEFDGRKYTVESKAYDLGKIILPDGRMLEAEAWMETYPAQPKGLHEVNHTFKNLEPKEIAELLNGVVAKEVQAEADNVVN